MKRGSGDALAPWLPRLGRIALGRRGNAPFSLSDEETLSLARAVRELSRGFTGARALAGKSYLHDPGSLAAYLLFYWPVSYRQARAVFRRFLGPDALDGANVLDLGSGPGPASAAAFDCGARRVLAVDPERRALDAARAIVRAGGHELGTMVYQAGRGDRGGRPPDGILSGGPYDLVYCGHVLNELWPGAADGVRKRADLIASLATLLSDRGRIVIVEPALLSTTRDLLRVRDRLAATGFPVIAPCLRQGPCPCLSLEAGESATCHADVAWNPPAWYVRLAHRARIGKESLRFSFLVVGKPGEQAVSRADGEYRVVSERMLSKSGRFRYMICNESGRRSLSAKPAGDERWLRTFMGLDRYDRIVAAGTEERENGIGLVPGSGLKKLPG